MKFTLRGIGIGLLVVLLLTVGIVLSGIVPAKASSGHWAITTWVLEFAMERSVATNSRSITVPSLDEAAVIQGAGHYEVGCRWCHGAPRADPARIVTHMTPPPSNLKHELDQWSDAQLFYIVRHGVLFTGMPAWPAHDRDDEVWGVVAFLKRFNQLTPAEYAQLAGINERHHARQSQRVDNRLVDVVVDRCVACHGIDGQGRSAFPILAGQKLDYLLLALKSYRSGSRPSGTMGPLAAELTDDQIEQAARYYASLSSALTSPIPPASSLDPGRLLAELGDASRRVGACSACHPFDSGSTPLEDRAAAEYPLLNGQRMSYLVNQLHLFRSQRRGGGDWHHLMVHQADELTDQQIIQVARFYSQQSANQ